MNLFQPKRDHVSVIQQLYSGLQNHSIMLTGDSLLNATWDTRLRDRKAPLFLSERLNAVRLRVFYGGLFIAATSMFLFGVAQIMMILTGRSHTVSVIGAGLLAIAGVFLLVEFHLGYRIDFPRK